MYDPHTREPRGFAFVTMDGLEAAEAAIAGMNGVDLLGRVLSVQKVSVLVLGRLESISDPCTTPRHAVDEHVLLLLVATLDLPRLVLTSLLHLLVVGAATLLLITVTEEVHHQ